MRSAGEMEERFRGIRVDVGRRFINHPIQTTTAGGITIHHRDETTIDFTGYLRHLRGTAAYHSDPYIQKVEEWGDGMHQMMLMMLERWLPSAKRLDCCCDCKGGAWG